jgi:Transposase DDE domain
VKRKCRKISPHNFVAGFILSCCNGKNTYLEWAKQISFLSGKVVSRQGVFDRLHEDAVTFAQQLLKKALLHRTAKDFASTLFTCFEKVLLQDSSTLHLPDVLASIFPGNHSRGKQKAVARIQSIFNIKAMQFLSFSLDASTQNDQGASKAILPLVSKGDLVIRDLGYFSLAVFEQLIESKVHILSRLRYGLCITSRQGKSIELRDLLRQKHGVDRWVYIGSDKKVLVRLVMIPMPAAQAAERIRKAKQDRDARLNHSTQYYQWLTYSVFITTVDEDVWQSKQVAQAYKVRWQIEIIFKSWKTGFKLQQILHEGCTNEYRVRVSIFLLLMYICLFMQKIYIRYKKAIERKNEKQLSILKLTIYIGANIREIIELPDRLLYQIVIKNCCFEKRNLRSNMTDLYQN